jgi:hypothetical protein
MRGQDGLDNVAAKRGSERLHQSAKGRAEPGLFFFLGSRVKSDQ